MCINTHHRGSVSFCLLSLSRCRRAPDGESTTGMIGEASQDDAPRKRRKLADDEVPTEELERQLAGWISLDQDINRFNMQHVKSTSRLVFSFVEGPLVQALRNGEWLV